LFKVTRIVWNNADQPISGLYRVLKPTINQPYWQLLYHNPDRTIYLSGNVKIINTEQRPASDTICEANQIVSPTDLEQPVTWLADKKNPYNYLRKKKGS
jgi:hypothetical protein